MLTACIRRYDVEISYDDHGRLSMIIPIKQSVSTDVITRYTTYDIRCDI